MAKDVSISFAGELSELKNSLDGMKSYVKGWGDTIKGIGAAAFAFVGAKEAISLGVSFAQEANEAAAVQAKLEAVVKATGNAAGFSADQMADMALELRKVTQIDDDVIKGAQTIIATFKEIRDDEFKRTTAAAVDMAAILGGDASSAAMQLGKALNEPEKGLAMLAKSGVSFTEEQKKLVKTMVEAGDVAGAQGIILGELEGQFGGAAAAAADATGPWAEFAFIMGDVREAIGKGLLAVIEPLLPMLEEGAELVSSWADSFAELGPVITETAAVAIEFLVGWFEVLSGVASSALAGISELWVMVFGESATGPVDSLFGFVKDVFTGMLEIAVGYFSALQTSWGNLPTVASIAWDSIKLGAISLFEDLKHFFTSTAPEIIIWFADNWQEIFTDLYTFTATVFENMFENIVTFFSDVWGWLAGEEASFEFKALTDGFESSLKELPNIAERNLTDTEKALQGRIGEQGAMLAGAFKKNYDANMKALGLGADVEGPEAPGAAIAASATAEGGRTPRGAGGGDGKDKKEKEFASGFEDLGGLFKRIQSSAASGQSPEAKAASKTADASEKTAEETKKTAEKAGETVKELKEIKQALRQPARAVWE